MTRTPDQILRAMATAADLVDFADGVTWRDALFDGDVPSPAAEPDRALLAAIAREHVGVDAHRAALPARLGVEWLERILGVPRLPVVPDTVVATAQVDPALAPAVVPAGTVLRGGTDAFGNERRYRTTDALTAHGAALAGMRVTVPGGPTTGTPGLAFAAPDFPIAVPQGDDAPVEPAAAHVLRIASPLLAFPGGDMRVRLTFTGPGVAGTIGAFRAAARWRHPRADGSLSPSIVGGGTGSSIDVSLSGGCVDPAGGDPWIECEISGTTPVPESFAFDSVAVAVIERVGVAPDAAFANEGAVDVTKEFEPFLATGSKGDAFYVRCDEALAKPLASITVAVALVSAKSGGTATSTGGGLNIPDLLGGGEIQFLAYSYGGGEPVSVSDYYVGNDHVTINEGAFDDLVLEPTKPSANASVRWERLAAGGWQSFGSSSPTFGGVTAPITDVGSLPTSVSGQAGRYLRAYIASGDLGWNAYQRLLSEFATKAVQQDPTLPGLPTPIVPALYKDLTVAYTTQSVAATRVESWSGWRHLVKTGGAYAPFRTAVADDGATGMVAIGLELPDGVAGSTVTLYVDLDSAAPCGSTDSVGARWEWWDGSAWQPLLVADGTHLMREAGLLRFVAPAGWAAGCEGVSAAAGRWIRFVTHHPTRIGVIRGVIPDAVLAAYASQAPDPDADPTPATPLPPGAIKGMLAPIPGVKKLTNLASIRGRGPEPDAAYGVRAAARTRHRGRALTAWDYEQTVALAFPEVAAVRCLPHTDGDGERAPGTVGVVVVPDQPLDSAPRPSVSLAGRIRDALAPVTPVNATVAILCPLYVTARVVATVTLRRGVAALTGKAAVTAALEALLHPAARPARWGVSLYASTLVAALEKVPEVDVVTDFEMRDGLGTAVEALEVDACRGLYCSAGDHALTCEEQL